ncbi:hypothetical protein LOK49_LG01G02138 [Camellia lanceoleosa]|uniref:Uncharacterized protein n=1 Tax=Camellia lanceoleosa TaxID=1840588 RepID=A0ACC0J069_9ERIC|nr:hypothetical protein LOK49_LG01G02138 [Camellia lanceoleosa]
MDENSVAIEAILRGGEEEGEEEEESSKINNIGTVNNDGGWKTVSYQKRHRKKSVKAPEAFSDLKARLLRHWRCLPVDRAALRGASAPSRSSEGPPPEKRRQIER